MRELSGRAQTRPALDKIQHAPVVIAEGGTLTVKAANGNEMVYIGGIRPAHADGTDQYGVVINREDGTPALAMWSNGRMPQGIDIYDSRGSTIFTEDRVNGGLAVPYLHSVFYPDGDISQYPRTQSGSPEILWTAAHIRYHPMLSVAVYAAADNGTTGAVQVYVDGQPWGEQHNLASNDWIYAADGPRLCPGETAAIVKVEIKAWRTSGAGNVYACASACVGTQTR